VVRLRFLCIVRFDINLAWLVAKTNTRLEPPVVLVETRRFGDVKRPELKHFQLVVEADQFPTDVASSHLCIVHNTRACRADKAAEKLRRQKGITPFLQVPHRYIIPWRDHRNLVQAPNELDHDLPRAVIVHVRKLTDVALALQQAQHSDNHLARRPDHNLALASLFRVGDASQSICKNVDSGHL
jgi:hypothetical protein